MTRHLPHERDQIAHAGLASAAHVDHAPIHVVRRRGRRQRLDHVVHVNVIAALRAIAIHHERRAREGVPEEARDHRGVRGGQGLARPVGVEHAQGHGLNPPQRADGAHVILGGEFAHGVRAARVGDGVLAQRLRSLLTVDRA